MSISTPTYHLTAFEFLWGLMKRKEASWALRSTGSSTYPTNPDALHYVIDLNKFRLQEINKVVVLGLRGFETAHQQRADYNEGLAIEQQRNQNVAITQIGMAKIIRDCIRARLRNNAAVDLYVCDQDFSENTQWALEGLDFTVFGRDELSRHINQDTLVYNVTMLAGGLQSAVDLSWEHNTVPPAAVITHMNALSPNGAFDVDLLGNYWLAPLLDSTPSLIAPQQKSQTWGAPPGAQRLYRQWMVMRQRHSPAVQQGYFEEAAAHGRDIARYLDDVVLATQQHGGIRLAPPPTPRESWVSLPCLCIPLVTVSDPMIIMLCRKDCPRPPLIAPDPQQLEPLAQQEQSDDQQEEEEEDGWSEGHSGEAYELEGAAEHGGSSNVSYASMPGPYGHGVFGSHDGGPGQYLGVPQDRHGNWP